MLRMKNITKKVIIYSFAAIVQIGLGTAVLEASPVQDEHKQQSENIIQEQRQVLQQENNRHEWAMKRQDNESDRRWQERRRQENKRHELKMSREGEKLRHARLQQENDRHRFEMERRHNESECQWQERQQLENQRHERMMWEVQHMVIDLMINR